MSVCCSLSTVAEASPARHVKRTLKLLLKDVQANGDMEEEELEEAVSRICVIFCLRFHAHTLPARQG